MPRCRRRTVARMRDSGPAWGRTDNDSHAEAADARMGLWQPPRASSAGPVWNATKTVERHRLVRAFHERTGAEKQLDLSAYVADARAAKLDGPRPPERDGMLTNARRLT